MTITDENGVTSAVTTSAFGYYHFDNITAGSNITIVVSSKSYRFAPRNVQVADSLTDVDFTGIE